VSEIKQIRHSLENIKEWRVWYIRQQYRCWRSGMRRKKPDMVMALMVVFALGVLATGYAQALSGS
jgi:nanoRNase/pAp phosphatase (c-di-AMP/oligoRNAs hydrolase)